jgi:hypothetical protein
MILSDQACVVLGWDGSEHGWYDPWSEETDEEAKAIGGYVVQANSEPAHIFADFRSPVIASVSYDGIGYHEVTGWDIGPDGDSGNRLVSDGDETTYSVPLDNLRTDHSRCAAEAHDRSLPDDGGRPYDERIDENGFLSDKQSYGPDGLLACNDCGQPLLYCRIAEWYFHVDPEAGCWMHEAWGLSA